MSPIDDEVGARLEALETRVRMLEGHASILDLKSRYGALADARYTRRGPKPQAELDPPPGPRLRWLDEKLSQHAFVVLLFYRGFW